MKLILFSLAIILSLAGSQSSAADDAPQSVAEFTAAKEKWNDLLDKPQRVEGRVTAVSKHQFRFVHCDLTFHVTEDQSRRVGNAGNVQVTGRIKRDKDSGKLYFAVDRVEIVPSDLEQFDLRDLKLKSTKPADWYDLAAWALERSDFYKDDDLAGRSRRAWRKGFGLERAGLENDDWKARLALAAKLKDREIDEKLQAELTHEAAHLKWQTSARDRKEAAAFAEWLAETYPASGKPLKTWPADFAKQYEANALKTYRDADAGEREQIPRLLMVQAELAQILPLAKADGSNAATIADAIRQRVPERTELIDKYSETLFQHRLKTVATAARADALKLADELKSRERPDDAKKLLQSWLTAQEPRLRKDGPIGLMQLADDYLRLVDDEPAAVKFLAEAHELDPSFDDAGDRLKQLGYRLNGKNWSKTDGSKPEKTPAGKVPGPLAVGMSADEVLSHMGSPTAKTRVITRNGVAEVWSFGPRGTPRLLIHLGRAPTDEKLKVTRLLTEQ